MNIPALLRPTPPAPEIKAISGVVKIQFYQSDTTTLTTLQAADHVVLGAFVTVDSEGNLIVAGPSAGDAHIIGAVIGVCK